MKCLIIANDIGLTAPGIVYESILRELSKTLKIDVISIAIKDGLDLPIRFLKVKPTANIHYRIKNLSYKIFKMDIFDRLWLIRQKSLMNHYSLEEYDVIISFTSNNNFQSILLGRFLSRVYKKKWVVYSVDAIPAPLEWTKDAKQYDAIKNFISAYLSYCDAFFASNQAMLNYQLKIIGRLPRKVGVIYTPFRTFSETFKSEGYELSTNPIFLYTGKIYGPRKVDALLGGFRKLLIPFPNAKLIFVGVSKHLAYNGYEDLIKSGNVELYEFTNDLTNFYNRADVLIDINSYKDDDVFLSSKIINYLPLNKPIVSLTGLNSPARNIFHNDESIIHCRHNIDDVYSKLKFAISHSFDYSNRRQYINMFNSTNVVKPLLEILQHFNLNSNSH